MNKDELSFGTILFTTFICGLVIYVCMVFTPAKRKINELYQVYLSGEKLGLINSIDELYSLIDEEQKEIKEKYKVSKVYPPSGLEIQKILTYNDNVKSAKQIYEDIKDIDPFTIEGYEVTIKYDNSRKNIYILNKDDLDTAIRNTVLSFVDEDDYNNYLAGKEHDLTQEGKELTDVYLDNEVSIKKTYISTEENIFTDSDSLSQYFLFGTTDLTKKYKVTAADTIETIADKNKLGVADFLVANPDIGGENALLAEGQEVNVAPISPLSNIVVESFETEIETITYDTHVEYDRNMNASETYTKQAGKDGQSKVTYATKEINGVIISTAQISEEVLSEAVDKIIVVGAKNVVYYGNSTYWAWPTSKPFRISDNYGWRVHPIRHETHFHPALDITGTSSKNIYAIQDGTVTSAVASGYNSGAGKNIIIDHHNGYTSQYMHLSKVLVKKGDEVVKGQTIGIMGCTGSCTGTHLDFRVKKNGQYINPFSLYK